jgi:hypothetical protein
LEISKASFDKWVCSQKTVNKKDQVNEKIVGALILKCVIPTHRFIGCNAITVKRKNMEGMNQNMKPNAKTRSELYGFIIGLLPPQ